MAYRLDKYNYDEYDLSFDAEDLDEAIEKEKKAGIAGDAVETWAHKYYNPDPESIRKEIAYMVDQQEVSDTEVDAAFPKKEKFDLFYGQRGFYALPGSDLFTRMREFLDCVNFEHFDIRQDYHGTGAIYGQELRNMNQSEQNRERHEAFLRKMIKMALQRMKWRASINFTETLLDDKDLQKLNGVVGRHMNNIVSNGNVPSDLKHDFWRYFYHERRIALQADGLFANSNWCSHPRSEYQGMATTMYQDGKLSVEWDTSIYEDKPKKKRPLSESESESESESRSKKKKKKKKKNQDDLFANPLADDENEYIPRTDMDTQENFFGHENYDANNNWKQTFLKAVRNIKLQDNEKFEGVFIIAVNDQHEYSLVPCDSLRSDGHFEDFESSGWYPFVLYSKPKHKKIGMPFIVLAVPSIKFDASEGSLTVELVCSLWHSVDLVKLEYVDNDCELPDNPVVVHVGDGTSWTMISSQTGIKPGTNYETFVYDTMFSTSGLLMQCLAQLIGKMVADGISQLDIVAVDCSSPVVAALAMYMVETQDNKFHNAWRAMKMMQYGHYLKKIHKTRTADVVSKRRCGSARNLFDAVSKFGYEPRTKPNVHHKISNSYICMNPEILKGVVDDRNMLDNQ